MTASPAGPPDYLRHVRSAAAPELVAALESALRLPKERAPVSVTDLVDPRPAYFRAVSPVEPSAAHLRRRADGEAKHRRYERLVGSPEQREHRVERDGVVGQIDVMQELPIEIKSTASLPDAARLVEERPNYVEQLALYCALTDRPRGRLVLIEEATEGVPAVVQAELEFGPPEELRRRLLAQATALREALDRRDPSALPRCQWFGRGCEYQEARVCPCSGGEATEVDAARATLRSLRPDPEGAAALADRIRRSRAEPVPIPRYADLAYPLKRYFESTTDPTPTPTPSSPRGSGDRPPATYYRDLLTALARVPSGRLVRQPAAGDVPAEPVARWDGSPLVLKTSRTRYPPRADRMPEGHPHYALELGLRAAAVGQALGWLVVGYEALTPEEGPLRAYRFDFEPLPYWVGLLAERREKLRRAVETRDPIGLPVCPAWMCPSCPYRGPCGDGAAAGGERRQR